MVGYRTYQRQEIFHGKTIELYVLPSLLTLPSRFAVFFVVIVIFIIVVGQVFVSKSIRNAKEHLYLGQKDGDHH